LVKLGLYTGNVELEGLRSHLESGRFNLIVFRENGEIIGQAIWHETNTEEHKKGGDPREKEDMATDPYPRKKWNSDFEETDERQESQEKVYRDF